MVVLMSCVRFFVVDMLCGDRLVGLWKCVCCMLS